MTFNNAPRGRAHAWIRNHIVGVVALCVALSGTAVAASGDNASTSAVSNKKFKNLKKRVAALEGRTTPITPTPVIPTTLPPSGPAGGVLDGTYPNPGLGDNTVGVTELIDGNVNSAKVADNSLGAIDLAANSIHASEMGDNITVRAANVAVPGGTAENGAYSTREATASCLAGEEVISGGAFWVTGQADDRELFIGEIQVLTGTEAVIGRGGNDSGTDATLQVHAYCLV